ncbi:major facilitator superfamily domain-containing protein [Apodospora peruviana]|uniref:Major facilitator superfamily domain-containing protein n=1 Tax=Apodospora peruviana TaxID=516989 RepID=A0AAE0LXZ7_9PEZI|nr:major facilitator superfamily domain-containing protein [Apodospora peruviana]
MAGADMPPAEAPIAERDNTTVEKRHPVVDLKTKTEQLHEHREEEGYIVDVDSEEAAHEAGLKLAKDGHTRLIPQPSDDRHDPLNWSWAKKHAILFTISWTAFIPDYGSATGAAVLIAQAMEWNMTPDEVNHSQAGNVFMLGVGGVVAVMLSAYFGRLPVSFWFILLATATAAWCAGATSFESFMAARILNGFFSTIMQVVGLIFINDVFFFHEKARKINIWASFFVMSPYVGPLFSSFIVETKHWSVAFWVYFAMSALALGLITFGLQETYYDRTIPATEQPPSGSRGSRLVGVSQWKSRHLRNTIGQACWRTVQVVLKPTVFITCLFYILTFAWAVGINTTLALFLTPLYDFGPKQVGYFYFTPVVAVALAEAVGHFLFDFLAKGYIRRHKGHFEPEVRLYATFVAMPFVIVGLVLIGQCFERQWHFMVTSVCWGMYVFGMMITTVSLSSYCLDSYPEAAGEVSAWINFSRTLGGFIVSYEQVSWATAMGTKASFGIQAGICAASFLLVLGLLRWGKALRVWAGPLGFVTS